MNTKLVSNRPFRSLLPLLLVGALSACGETPRDQEAPATLSAAEKSAKTSEDPTSPGAPVKISHSLVGTAVVGQPLAINLSLQSLRGVVPMQVEYRINDSTAMRFPEQQVRAATVSPDSVTHEALQQVTIVPQREGRLYLNVSVGVRSDTGISSTVMAIPIQVGTGPRSFEENGQLTTDAEGNPIRSLPASSN
ncbi:MAG: hypothetical protein AAFX56_20920 [Pseudomonadota bacterium]